MVLTGKDGCSASGLDRKLSERATALKLNVFLSDGESNPSGETMEGEEDILVSSLPTSCSQASRLECKLAKFCIEWVGTCIVAHNRNAV